MTPARSNSLTTVLFDLDGTLIDSIELILRSFRHTLSVHDKPALSDAEWLRGVGTPLRAQLAAIASDEDEIDAMIATYRAWNLEHHDGLVHPYPGAVAAVSSLRGRGIRTGVVTSKLGEAARRGLAVCGFGDSMEVVIGADDVERHKPDPTPVLHALERLAVPPERALFVGDSPHDIHAGRAARVKTAAALWGPFDRADLEPAGPDLWLERPVDMASLA